MSWPPSLTDVKNFLNIKDDGVDEQLTQISDFGQAFVERYTNRLYESEERTYVIDGNGTARMYLPDWPITGVTTIHGPCYDSPRHFVTDGGSVDSAELVDSDNYRIGGNPRNSETLDHIQLIGFGSTGLSGHWNFGEALFEVVATTGYSDIPSDLYMATIAVIAEYWQMFKQGRVGLTSKAVDAGSLAYEVTRNLDLHSKSILDRYRRVQV